ncbi:sugar ABC transporter ATP-binding protein [Rhizobiales bacterium Sp-1]|uniref:Sugar ABC transporter ATP-binding protein n=1 Tax=Segnochrobactrum spirostomi TaxID=2608987 RepID=A0A6A7Y6R4_9HYPH|nr:sugar ABC transporter ATP-binding protein [Segnochrobactrum spirostomi]
MLADISIALRRGEIRALLGENGAGKSTLINLLSGVLTPESGTIAVAGAPVRFARPIEAWAAGITTIRQEFSLFPDLSVAESLFAGHLPLNRLGLVDRPRMRREAKDALSRLGYAIDPDRTVASLSVAEQQLVEIARALTHRSRILIMDEPTASLSPAEVEHLKAVVRALAADGIAVLYVSHRLEEVIDLCDSFTVLRDGRHVAEGRIAGTGIDDLVRLMVGRDLEAPARRAVMETGDVVLDVVGLSTPPGAAPAVRDASFSLRAGEVVGVAGLVGAGRTELARMIFGADPVGSGTLRLKGRDYRPRSPKDAIAAGLAFVPEDRKKQGLFLGLDVLENFAAVAKRAAGGELSAPFGLVDRRAERARFAALSSRLSVRAARLDAPIAVLSGGNQQKVVLARWLETQPAVLIVDEPTRGVDIGAKTEIHRLLRALAADGVAVLVISSDLPEILAVSDRILTLCAGRLTGDLAAADASEEALMRLMTLGLDAPGGAEGAPTPATRAHRIAS